MCIFLFMPNDALFSNLTKNTSRRIKLKKLKMNFLKIPTCHLLNKKSHNFYSIIDFFALITLLCSL